MAENREERVRERAREIWEREGKPDGRQEAHWAQAAEEIDAEGEGGGSSPSGAAEGQPSGGAGLSSGLQPGGSVPSGGPGAGTGSLGTGGASTAGNPTGAPKKRK